MKYISIEEAARIRGEGRSSIRNRAAAGLIPGAIQPNRNWLIPFRYAYGYGRAPEVEQASPRYTTTDEENDVVLAINEDQRYGVYIGSEWYSADEILEVYGYVGDHFRWLYEGRAKNRRGQCEHPNINNIPKEDRPSEKAWTALVTEINKGQATLDYEDEVFIACFDTRVIPLGHLAYDEERGLYDGTHR